MTAAEKVLSIALAEEDYLEKASPAFLDDKTANAGDKNYTKYARDLDAIKGFYNGRKQGSPWCDVFVDWPFVQAFGPELAAKVLCQPMGGLGAGVKYSAQYYKAKGRFFERGPQICDQIFFVRRKGLTITAWLHTGLVTAVDSTYVYTIEGNTSGASGVVSNGGGVCRKRYKLNSSSIGGYGRPDWSLVKEEYEMTEKEIKAQVDAAVAEKIKPLDEALNKAIRELAPETYKSIEDVPEFWREEIAALIKAGAIKGDGTGALNLNQTAAQVLAAVARLHDLVRK